MKNILAINDGLV